MPENVEAIPLAQGWGAVTKVAEDELVVLVTAGEQSFAVYLTRQGVTVDGKRVVATAVVDEDLKTLVGW